MHKAEQQVNPVVHIRAAAEALAAYAAQMQQQTARSRFQFSSATHQRTEALNNVQEAKALCAPWEARALAGQGGAPELQPPTTEAGQCFRRVSAILAGRGK